MNRRLQALAALAICVPPALPCHAETLTEAVAGTYWGEPPEALQRHFGPRGFALPRPLDFGDSYAPLVLRDAAIGGVGLIAYYQIDKTTHGLKRIQLERPRHRVGPAAFQAVFGGLVAAYGRPDMQCGTSALPANGYQGAAEYVWRRDGLVIRAIFRDTTLEALGGCYSPACGLTAQLLVRISPPAEDKATCPPPPSESRLRVQP